MPSDRSHAGKYNRRVTIYQPTNAVGVYGETNAGDYSNLPSNPGWTNIGVVWAQIAPARGYEVMQSQEEMAAQFLTVTCRYVSTKNVTEKMIMVYNLTGAIYGIQTAIDIEGEHREMEFLCKRIT